MGTPVRMTLLERVQADRWDPHHSTHRRALEQDDLPEEPPKDATRPMLPEVWQRLRDIQEQYRGESDTRLKQALARMFRDEVAKAHAVRTEAKTVYDFVSGVIGPHPRSGAKVDGGLRMVKFAHEFLVHTKGRWAGQPLDFEPWQVDECRAIFGRVDDQGLRLIQEAYVQEPKKNGKSTRAAAWGGYLLLADDEPGAEVYGGATDKEQARIVFGQLVSMVEKSPLYRYVVIYKDSIYVPSTDSFYKVIAADAISDEGVNMHGGILDELHHHDRAALYDMLSRSGDAREQPFLGSITNAPAYTDPEASVCSRVRAQGLRVIAGEPDARDDMYASIDEIGEDEIEDRDAWARVNKASWITLDVLERSRRKSRPVDFLRYRLNHPADDDEASFLAPGVWEACTNDVADLVKLRGLEGWLAVDFATHKDTASVGWQVQRPDWGEGQPGRWLVGGHVWGVTPDDPDKPAPPCHTLLPKGESIRYALVEDKVREWGQHLDLVVMGFDPWRFNRSAELLADEGVPVEPFPQSNERTAPASEELLDGLVTQAIWHADDPVLAAHVKNAVTKSVGRGWRLDKTKARRAMDYATTLMMTHSLAASHEPQAPSVYETRGLQVISGGGLPARR